MARLKDARIPTTIEFATRFWLKVKIGSADECWEWQAPVVTRGGYGQINCRGVVFRSHRVAFVLENGPQPDGSFICHKCNNPRCCNPAHLYCGDARTNWADTLRAGNAHKLPALRGCDCPSAKLTADQVRMVRSSPAGHAELARNLGVTRQAIFKLRKGTSWKTIQ